MKPKLKPVLVLVLVMALLLSGCGVTPDPLALLKSNYTAAPNTPISSDSKWIDSSILGSVDSTLQANLKDDFFTAVNLDWLLEQKMPEGKLMFRPCDFSDSQKTVEERKLELIAGNAGTESNLPELSSEELSHTTELVLQYAAAAADWEGRNAAGAEPLRRYTDKIAAITTTDELTAFLTDLDSSNFSGESFLGFVQTPTVSAGMNVLVITPLTQDDLVLYKSEYLDYSDSTARTNREKQVRELLGTLNYTDAQIDDMLTRCYRLEGILIDHDNSETAKEYSDTHTMEELVNLCGNFPIQAILESRGLGQLEEYRIVSSHYMKYLSSLYTQSSLEDIKAYLTVHVTLSAANYLTRDSFETYQRTFGNLVKKDDPMYDIYFPSEEKILLNFFVQKDMGVPLEILYIANYCSYEQKQAVVQLCEEFISTYRTVLENEDWMTETGRLAALEKLDAIRIRALYPDTFDSYLGLSFEKDDDLMAMVQKINAFEIRMSAANANQPNRTEVWNLKDLPTSDVNACYIFSENSINVFAGYLASGNAFNLDEPIEMRLAALGTVVGHEITHGFDSTGICYDKDGGKNLFMGMEDQTIFETRSRRLVNYFNGFTYYPGGANVKGDHVSGEAIADMGGVLLALKIAENIEDFDYELFFHSYAESRREAFSYGLVKFGLESDEHPLAFLRVNAVLQQFEEFYETYDIQPGDGMYLAPENRVAVW